MENPFEIIMQRLDRIEILINEIKKDSKEENELLNIEEVAKFLKISKSTVYGYTNKNFIPFMKKGKKLFFYKSEIEQWIIKGRNTTKNELEIRSNEYLFESQNR